MNWILKTAIQAEQEIHIHYKMDETDVKQA